VRSAGAPDPPAPSSAGRFAMSASIFWSAIGIFAFRRSAGGDRLRALGVAHDVAFRERVIDQKDLQ
jgi:hypothetical protein